MKAVETEDTNLRLTLPGAGEDRTLPAQRIVAYDPELGETPDDGRQAILTVWKPDPGDRRALFNGAQIELVVTGTQHPPVSMTVGPPDPESMEALLSKAHADRAVGFWFAALGKRLAETGELGTAEEVLELWHKALEETKEGKLPVDFGERVGEVEEAIDDASSGTNGKGSE